MSSNEVSVSPRSSASDQQSLQSSGVSSLANGMSNGIPNSVANGMSAGVEAYPNEHAMNAMNSMGRTAFESVMNSYTNRVPNGVNLQYFFEIMKSEWNRLRSYRERECSQWSASFVSPEELANAGFFYLNGDRVQCAFCRGVVSGWEPGDRPLAEHARHFPRCPFIMEEDVGNVAIAHDPIRGPKPVIGRDVCGNYTAAQMSDPLMNSINTTLSASNSSLDMREYGVQPHRGPKNQNYSSIDARRRSYVVNCWDSKIPVNVDTLAEAGFFSIGVSDYVKCFYCDGGLCNWEEGDEPWVEHAKWFPDCEFVTLNKSHEFIDECRSRAEDNSIGQQNNANEVIVNANDDSNDSLGMRAVNEWMCSDIVLQLIDLNTYPLDTIKATLNRRWRQERQPFNSFNQLYDAICQMRTNPNEYVRALFYVMRYYNTCINRVTPTPMESEDESYFSGSQSSSSSSNPSSTSSSTSQSSINSISSQSSESPPQSLESSSPPPSLLGSSPETSLSDLSVKSDDNRLLCKICLDREIGVVFLPCGHQLACTQCAPCMTDCPICRQLIRGTVRTFFS